LFERAMERKKPAANAKKKNGLKLGGTYPECVNGWVEYWNALSVNQRLFFCKKKGKNWKKTFERKKGRPSEGKALKRNRGKMVKKGGKMGKSDHKNPQRGGRDQAEKKNMSKVQTW